MNTNDVSAAMVAVLFWIALAGIGLCLIKLSSWSWKWKPWYLSRWRFQLYSSSYLFPISMLRLVSGFCSRFWCPVLQLKAFAAGVFSCSTTGQNSGSFLSESLSESRQDRSELEENDLKQLMSYIANADGGPPWQFMMEHSTPTLTYQAWCRDPMVGPIQFRTRTIFWNVSPELVRDFFWDDQYRSNWDDMLIYHETLEMHPQTGAMIVHWIRKLPLLYGNKEYVIIRRIWESNSTYYCVTKGTSYPCLQRLTRSRQVDVYYSGWFIRAVESRNAGQRQTGCEVLLFHYEDIRIPKRLVKMGAWAGMRGFVRRLDAGVQAYNAARATGAAPSSFALNATLTTKVADPIARQPPCSEEIPSKGLGERKRGKLKWLIMGGLLMAVAISLTNYSKRSSSHVANKRLTSFSNHANRSNKRH